MADLVYDDMRQAIQGYLNLVDMGSTVESASIKTEMDKIDTAGKTPAEFATEIWQAFMDAKNEHYIGNDAMWGDIAHGICEYLNSAWGSLISGGTTDWKDSCRLCTTTDHSLSGLAMIDGVTPVAGNRILVTGQSDARQNGIYTAAAGAWTRSSDTSAITAGMTQYVEEGSTNKWTYWYVTSYNPIVIGVSNIVIEKWSWVDPPDPPSYNSDWKDSVRAASGQNEDLDGEGAFGGVSVVADDRVLAFGQTDAKYNGIYVVGARAWRRADDACTSDQVTNGMTVYVGEGTYAKQIFTLTTHDPIVLDTTALTFKNYFQAQLETCWKHFRLPTETPNGIILIFTLPLGPTIIYDTLQVQLNRVLQIPTVDYTVSELSHTITFIAAPETGDIVTYSCYVTS